MSTYILKKLNYVSADCGSGKTTQICREIERSSKNFIIVQNTIELIQQTSRSIAESRMIVTDKNDESVSVIDKVIEFLLNPTHRVLIISDKSFFRVPLNLLTGWKIYLDDVTNFHTFKNINEPTKSVKNVIYTDVFQGYEELGGSEKYVTAKKKDVDGEIISKLAKEFAMVDENDIFIMNGNYFTDDDKSQLNITAWKDLNKYCGLDITFLGANFEKSLIYKGNAAIFKRLELPNLRERTIPVNERLKVYYFSEKTKLSKTWKVANQDKMKVVYDYLDNVLKRKEFYWTNNNKDKLQLKSGERISPDASVSTPVLVPRTF